MRTLLRCVSRRIALALILALPQTSALADDPKVAPDAPATQPATSQPALVKVGDKAAVDAAMGKDVIVDGVVDVAAWSSSGKVLRIEFKDADETKFLAVVFDKRRADFDSAYEGDFAKAVTGKHVRLKGTIKDYKGRPEIVLDQPSQVTILE